MAGIALGPTKGLVAPVWPCFEGKPANTAGFTTGHLKTVSEDNPDGSPPLSSAHSAHQGVAVAAAVFSPAPVSRLSDGQPRSASLASLAQSGI